MDFVSCTQALAPVPCPLAPTAADGRRMGAAEGLLTLTLKAKEACVEKKTTKQTTLVFLTIQMLSASESVHLLKLAGVVFLRAYECTHIHTYRVGKAKGKNKKVLGVTAISQQKWVRSEELCLASISDHMGPSEELFAYCPTTWTIFI